MKIFAERLKELRIEKGMSQQELAKACGFTNGAIAYWELGQREPKFGAVIILAKFFGVSLEYLAGLEN